VPEQLTGPGGTSVEAVRPGTETLSQEIVGKLAGWRVRLTESDTVLNGRQRAAAALDDRLKEVAEAERKADGLREQAEQLDGQLGDARIRVDQRGDDLVRASRQYADDVTSWAALLPDPVPVTTLAEMPNDPELPAVERAIGRDVPDAVARTAHDISDPVVKEYEHQRDEARERELSIGRELAAAQQEKQRWEAQADPEPPKSPYSSAERMPGTGAPLFLLVDFRGSVPDADRVGVEAALEASGLLDAWASADGVLLANGTRDVILRGADPVAGASLADVLRPVPGHGVSEAALDRLLRGIGLAENTVEPAARTWISRDGRYRLDVIQGAHGKDQAEYIGAAVRAATRQRRIAELTEQIGELRSVLDGAVAARKEIERVRDALHAALREIPKGRALADAWSAYDHAVQEVTRLAGLLLTARREAEQAAVFATALRTHAEAQATSDGLPADREQLGQLQRELAGLRKDFDAMASAAARTLTRLASHVGARTSWELTRQARVDAESGYATAYGKLTAARRELELLESSVGATEQDIMARETDAQDRLDEANRGLPRARTVRGNAHDDRLKLETDRDRLIDELANRSSPSWPEGSRCAARWGCLACRWRRASTEWTRSSTGTTPPRTGTCVPALPRCARSRTMSPPCSARSVPTSAPR
jgi:hypothetical protein